MDPARLRKLFLEVRRGRVTPKAAMEALASLPFESTGSATVDHHRGLRQHLPEVILCQGKTVAQCIEIARAIVAKSGRCLATRASEAQAEALLAEFDGRATWNERARAVVIAARAARRTAWRRVRPDRERRDLRFAGRRGGSRDPRIHGAPRSPGVRCGGGRD